MKNKEYMNVSDVAAEIEALHTEIKDLKKALRLTIDTLSDTVWAVRSFKEQRLIDADNICK